ncbi:MAG TPA: heme o synthase [Candidatus Nanopelagicales bacterium]
MTAVESGRVGAASTGPDMPRWKAYLALTKPRVIELLLVTTVPVMFLAAGGFPPLSLTLLTLLGGTMAAAGANVINQVYDRDIDAVMVRTQQRPLVAGHISTAAALRFGIVLSIASVVLLGLTVNWLSALLAAMAIGFYVFIYTMLLKRRTAQNIVWGGAAGCFPVLIGWSAVTGSLAWAPLVLFGIVFFWTPPHYWPLALRFKADYQAARVPMLPAVADAGAVASQIVWYSWAMVATSLLLTPVAGMTWLYTGAAVLLGAAFLWEAYALRRRVRAGDPEPRAMRLFHGSISYLSLLFLAVAIDPFLG